MGVTGFRPATANHFSQALRKAAPIEHADRDEPPRLPELAACRVETAVWHHDREAKGCEVFDCIIEFHALILLNAQPDRNSRCHGEMENHSLTLSTAKNASWGISTLPTRFIRRLPSFCFSSSFRLRVISPP